MTAICKKFLSAALVLELIVFTPVTSSAKTTSKFSKLAQLNKPENHNHNYRSFLKKDANELEATVEILFIGYKTFFSSQDMNSCVFTPSCSVYAVETFQHYNPFVAYLRTFDRLSRCHPLVAKKEYPYNYQIQKFYDPAY
jgi:putative component of membrane protein insertase Oxa1/YidC/SpoIIIJ protein YidD